jgi:hypothetical protein
VVEEAKVVEAKEAAMKAAKADNKHQRLVDGQSFFFLAA